MAIQKYIKFCALDLQRCSCCKQQKPYDNYAATKYYCKPCVRKKDLEYRERNKDKIRERAKKYRDENHVKILEREKK